MQKIKDYAIIGDGRSAALVGRDGSINWLCWPRFDSPSLFAKIVDEQIGGSWQIAPVLPSRNSRQYIEGTNVLQTTFVVESGTVVLTDFMVAMSEEEKQESLQPEHEIIRRVECQQGEVEIEISFNPKPNYARDKVIIKDGGALGIRLEMDRQLFTLRSDITLQMDGEGAWAKVTLRSGDKIDFSLSYTLEGPAVIPVLGEVVSQKLALTIAWWQNWSSKMTYKGSYREQVLRSVLALKLLGFAPSGAFVAAPTTSLPESIGRDLNWDYRFCWLRDAAFTVEAFFELGYKEEAEAFASWLLHSTRLSLPKLLVLYDVYGKKIYAEEKILAHLKGYEDSFPVQIGNAVGGFFELDVYGEVIESATILARENNYLDHETQKMLRKLGEYVCNNWKRKDTSIWEIAPDKHYTHSKLMGWVALDRLLELHQKGLLKKIPVELFSDHREQIRKEIEKRAWNDEIKSYTQAFDDNTVDAAVLVMPLYGFEKASSLRMQQTFEKIQERLSPAPGLVYRFERSLRLKEGAFGLCCFWNVEFLARGGGSLQQASEAFEQVLSYASDLGLFAEEIDPRTGDALGNFPQAFTHVGLIKAALALEERKKHKDTL